MMKLFSVKQLQILDATLNAVAYASKTNMVPKIVIKVSDSLMITGNFFFYYKGQAQIKQYSGKNDPYLSDVPTLNSADLLKHLNKISPWRLDEEKYARLLDPSDFFFNFAEEMVSHFYDLYLTTSPAFIYNPQIIGCDCPHLDFYALDENREYEVVSIFLEETQS